MEFGFPPNTPSLPNRFSNRFSNRTTVTLSPAVPRRLKRPQGSFLSLLLPSRHQAQQRSRTFIQPMVCSPLMGRLGSCSR